MFSLIALFVVETRESRNFVVSSDKEGAGMPLKDGYP